MNLTRSKKIFLYLSFTLVATTIILWNGIKSYERSLIDSISGPTLPVFPTATENTNARISDRINSKTPISTSDTSENEITKPKCNGPEQMLILVIGADNDYGYYRGLADVIQIFKINFVTAEIDILSVPRDLWVEIPGLEDQDIYEGKINQSYFYGNLYRLEGGGPTLLARTLYESFGLPVDHYFAINMVAFTNAINLLGGIDVNNPKFASDEQDYFPQGNIHLNGEDALIFSRIRLHDGSFARMDRQILVVKAIANKLLSLKYFIQIPGMINTFRDEIVTSLREKEIEMLLCIALQINIEAIEDFTIGMDISEQSWAYPSWAENGTWILIPDIEKIRIFVQDFIFDD